MTMTLIDAPAQTFVGDPGSRVDLAIRAVTEAGGEVIAAAALVDRSNGTADLGVPFFPLIRLDVPTYEADNLPPELQAIPAMKPGSRKDAAKPSDRPAPTRLEAVCSSSGLFTMA